MKRNRISRWGIAAAAIGTALAASGWLAFSGDTISAVLARLSGRGGEGDVAGASAAPAPGPRAAGAHEANAVAWFVVSAHAAAAASAPAASAPPAARASAVRARAAGASAAAAASADVAASAPARDRRLALATLDTKLIQERVVPGAKATDAFTAKSWVVAPPPPPPAPPPAPPPPPPPPQAPPLPFKYLGMLQEETTDRAIWYLLQGDRLIVVPTNEVIGATYRVDGMEGGRLRFTYLPLDQQQTLAIGGSP
jgi:pyruvate/2-oxoglutarate dehydrogenase complex dihydrolipoamide acyltransferase (E2) component